MTVPLAHVGERQPSLRVMRGRRLRRPSVAPWTIVVVVGVLAFLGLGFARTSLDRSAFELADLTAAIEEHEQANHLLTLQIARLENPSRIAPLAEQMGMVLPTTRNQLLVDLERAPVFTAGSDGRGGSQ